MSDKKTEAEKKDPLIEALKDQALVERYGDVVISPMPVEEETRAIQIIMEALTELDIGGVHRVMNYVRERVQATWPSTDDALRLRRLRAPQPPVSER